MAKAARILEILKHYDGEPAGVKANLARLLLHGRLAGTGRLVFLPVDQGVEHGPGRSFASNAAAYDPNYVFEIAIVAGLSALAAPLGLLRSGADRFAGEIPLILKANLANDLGLQKDQALAASVRDALELGCTGIGYTIYPGADGQDEAIAKVCAQVAEARACGLVAVIWAYPRGGRVSETEQSALDVVAYGAQIAAQIGAHIIKVKLPTALIAMDSSQPAYHSMRDLEATERRVAHVMESAFAGRRMVLFSGGPQKGSAELLAEARAIYAGGGHGSMVGRNVFQRPRADALALLDKLVDVYSGRS